MKNESRKVFEMPESDSRASTQRTVLVVDDEPVIADTLAAILRSSGFFAMAVYSGEAALQSFASRVPDLLITDICMPGINGIELAMQVRERLPRCQVLLFSGHASSKALLDEARAKGYEFQFLSKPIHPRDLLARLQCDDQPAVFCDSRKSG